MIHTTEDTRHHVTILRCGVCGDQQNVDTKDARFAYTEINRFRGRHEHLETIKKLMKYGKI